MLIGKLIELPIGECRKREADEVVEIETGIGDLLAVVGHEIGERSADDVIVAGMSADEVGIIHPEIVNRFAGSNFNFNLVDQLTFIEQFVTDFDSCDVGEGLGQGLRFVIVDAQNLRDGAELHALERSGRLDEPFHLGHLLVFA